MPNQEHCYVFVIERCIDNIGIWQQCLFRTKTLNASRICDIMKIKQKYNAYTGTKWIDTESNENFIVCNMDIKDGEFALDKTFLMFNIGKIFDMYGRGINVCYYSVNIGVLVRKKYDKCCIWIALTKIGTN